ncbi:MAG: plasmid pRiA4b ORF-3 family protein [Planctomycetaceae bacterium]|nr:plasmid pRiA4b ORF-3 family protein [Planctomycetaceae bacterium]
MAEDSSRSLSVRRNVTNEPGETYPLKLTWHQRDSLIHCTRIKNKLKVRLQELGEGTHIIGVTRKELDHLNDEVGQASVYAPHPDKKRLVAVLHKVAELFASDRVELLGSGTPKIRKTAPTKGKLLYQFKITLLEINPAIWRRIQVPDCSLCDLHEYIQAAFGWWDYHLHQFEIDGERYSEPGPDDDAFGMEFKDETNVLLSKLVPKSGRPSWWIYEYDFGDSWRHEVLFEGFPSAEPKAKYPLCVEGERACPQEDCGGPWGYAEYLAAIADPQHEQHQEMRQWRGPFDSEAFDAMKATKAMRRLR